MSESNQSSDNPGSDLKIDAIPTLHNSKPDQERSASDVQDDQERKINKYNNDKPLTEAMSQLQLKGNLGCINAQNLQIGNNNTMHVYAENTKEKVREKKSDPEKEFKLYLESGKILKPKDLTKISKSIGTKWRAIGRHLDIEDYKLDIIQHDYNKEGLEEIVYQMLRLWSKKSPSTCTVGTLARAFIDTENLELIHELPLDD